MMISMMHNPPRLGLEDHPIGIHMTRQTDPKYLVVDGIVRIMAYLALYGDLLGPAESVKFFFTTYAGRPSREGNYIRPLHLSIEYGNSRTGATFSFGFLRIVPDNDKIHPLSSEERAQYGTHLPPGQTTESSPGYAYPVFNIEDWE